MSGFEGTPNPQFEFINSLTEGLIRALGEAAKQQNRAVMEFARAESLRRSGMRDGLTGLYNRKGFDDHLNRFCARLTRANTDYNPDDDSGIITLLPIKAAVLSLDLDRFKKLNDRRGHPEGDRALTRVADIMSHHTRSGTDTVARVGGDEFMILLPEADEQLGIRKALKIKETVENECQDVTTSIGVAEISLDNFQDLDGVFKELDNSLYFAKYELNGNAVAGVSQLPSGWSPDKSKGSAS